MLELTQPDIGGIPISANPQSFQRSICKKSTGCHGGHAPMQSIETKRIFQKICRTLAGATYSAELDNFLGANVQFKASGNDHIRNAVMPTALAQRTGFPNVIIPG